MRCRASGAARLNASFCCICERALALSELRLLPISLTRCSPFSDVRCRIAQERVPTNLTCGSASWSASLPVATASANQIVEPRASSFAASIKLCCGSLTEPQQPSPDQGSSNPDANPRHTNSHDASKRGGSHHSSDDSSPSGLQRFGLAVTKPPQLRLNLIETFS